MGRKRRNQGLTVFNLPCDHADQAGSSAKRAQEAESEPAGTLAADNAMAPSACFWRKGSGLAGSPRYVNSTESGPHSSRGCRSTIQEQQQQKAASPPGWQIN
ncbi:unnamed protein product [Lepidochelys kempii]